MAEARASFLDASELTKHYGNVLALDGANFSAGTAITRLYPPGGANAQKIPSADPQQMQALQSNVIQLAVAQSPYFKGQDGVEQAVSALEGKPVTANIGTPPVAITRQNMNSATSQKYVYQSSW